MDLVETFFNTGSMLLSTKEKTLVSRPFLKIMFIVFNSIKNIKIKIKRHIYLNLRNDNCGHLCILLLDNLTKDNVYSFQLFKNIKIKIKRHIYLNLRNDNCGHLCILLLDNLTNSRLVKSRTIHISLHDEWINEKY